MEAYDIPEMLLFRYVIIMCECLRFELICWFMLQIAMIRIQHHVFRKKVLRWYLVGLYLQ